jgi:hypothetical protein
MAVVVLLGLIAIALAVSYGMLHAQSTSLRVQQNASRRQLARHAAETGLAVALARMHGTSWGGADSTFTGTLDDNESYTVTYETGDETLVAGSADEALWPYRVTIEAVGSSVDPDLPASPATHAVRAVVQLVPRGLSSEPPDWTDMTSHTVYQWTSADVTLEFPSRIEGPLWLQGVLRFAQDYPVHSSSRDLYLYDLGRMANANAGDYRLVYGTVRWRRTLQPSDTRTIVETWFGQTTQTISSHTSSDWTHPGALTSYRLYTGGKSYMVQTLAAAPSGTTLAADPRTNPAGLYYRAGDVALGNNVTVRGTMIASADVSLDGTSVTLQPADLPALDGETVPVRLPVVIAGDDFHVGDQASATVDGIVAAWDKFDVRRGSESVTFTLRGHAIAGEVAIGGREPWDYDYTTWSWLYNMFQWQLGSSSQVAAYYPTYLGLFGRQPQPKITLQPPATSAHRHWLRANTPIYQPASGDEGLRWQLIRREYQ